MLPNTLGASFSVREALTSQVSRSRLRARDLVKPFRGIRATNVADGEACLAALMRSLPKHAFASDETAARLWGFPLPLTMENQAFKAPVIAVPPNKARIRRKEVAPRRLKVTQEEVIEIRGIMTTDPSRTWFDLSQRLGLGDLVALTDYLIGARSQLCSRESLERYCDTHKYRPGGAKRRRALEICDENAESPMESITRTILVEGGVPPPQCNPPILTPLGRIFRADMLFEDAKVIVEYNGEYHRDQGQWRKDESRKSQLEDMGYHVMVVVAKDLKDPQYLVQRVQKLLSDRQRALNRR